MSRFRLIDPTHSFFAKPWRRWATVLVPGLWALWEVVNEQWIWAAIFAALAAHAYWVLILTFPATRD